MKTLLQNIKMVFRYWMNIFDLIFKDLVSLGKDKILDFIFIVMSWFLFVVASGRAIDYLVVLGYISDVEAWVRTSYAVFFGILVYGIILSLYYPAKLNKEKEKIIEDLLPEKPEIKFSYSEFPQVKGRQKLKIFNNSPSEIVCHARLSFIAPLILNNFLKYPDHYYSKNLVWSNRKSADGDIKIDGNGGSAVLDLVETSEQKFNFLFQDGDNVKVGYDDHPEGSGLTENRYLLGLRLDGKFNGKNFLVERKFLSSFEIRVLDKEKNKTMPFFTISEVVENSGGV